MKNIFLKKFLSGLFILTSFSTNAQHFDTVLAKLNRDYKQEKLYLQFDKSLYNPGETIWFKAYVFAGNYPSLISKTLYTELVDVKGKVIQRVTSPVMFSTAAGSLIIPNSASGAVYIRSYTKWMLNFDSSFIFSKAIVITAFQKTPANLTTTLLHNSNATLPVTVSSSFVLQFFPEGGDLVEGIESRVAFKATDRNGKPINITGEIQDDKGKKITSFTSIHDGMGVFTLLPEAGEHYKAVCYQQEQKHETNLPSAKQKGIVLEIDNFQNQVYFKIKQAEIKPSLYPFIYVVAQMNQQLLYRAKVNIDKTNVAAGTISTENLPAGIVQVTVFTPDEVPLAERIVFANSAGYSSSADISALVIDMDKRKKNTIRINMPDTIFSNLSVAVTDADINTLEEENNIFSNLLLTSDIKGYVYHPAYYFSSDEDSVANHLDLVMMTNGWRRFVWKDALAGHFPALKFFPENYLSIAGKISGSNKTLLSAKEINGILQFKDNKTEYLNIPVQPDGNFNFSGMIFYDTARLFYQFNKDKNKTLTAKANFEIKNDQLKENLNLPLDNYLLSNVSQPDTTTLIKNKEIYQARVKVLENNKLKILKEVVVTSKSKTKQQLINEEYTSGAFADEPGAQNRVILPDDDPAFLASKSLLDYLQGRIAGLQVDVNATEDAITWRGSPTALFVNEVSQKSMSWTTGKLIEDASYILNISMSEVAMVKIFDPPFFGAWGAGPGGAIAVYLKKGVDRNSMIKSLDYFTLPGYSPVKEFYSPDYSIPAKSDNPDYRSTLYWNPFVITDKKNQQVSLSFYNSDITKRIKIIVEGCNEDGKLIHLEKILQ